jgi:shikimate 5-dehydrogenase
MVNPAVAALYLARYAGISATYPCKEALLPLFDDVPEAREIGAVAIAPDGRTTGHNIGMSGLLPNSIMRFPVLTAVATFRAKGPCSTGVTPRLSKSQRSNLRHWSWVAQSSEKAQARG